MDNQPQMRLTLKYLKTCKDSLNQEINQLKKSKSEYPRWYITFSAITLLATGVIAISTLFSYLNSRNMLNQIKKQIIQTDSTITIQKEYYQKTVRPFLHTDSLTTILFSQRKDTTVILKYNIKNSGSQPAKEVACGMMLLEKKYEDFPFELGYTVIGSIYPDGQLTAYYRSARTSLKDIRKSPYIHILVRYKDVANLEYTYKSIIFIKTLEIGHRDIIHIWQEFD